MKPEEIAVLLADFKRQVDDEVARQMALVKTASATTLPKVYIATPSTPLGAALGSALGAPTPAVATPKPIMVMTAAAEPVVVKNAAVDVNKINEGDWVRCRNHAEYEVTAVSIYPAKRGQKRCINLGELGSMSYSQRGYRDHPSHDDYDIVMVMKSAEKSDAKKLDGEQLESWMFGR